MHQPSDKCFVSGLRHPTGKGRLLAIAFASVVAVATLSDKASATISVKGGADAVSLKKLDAHTIEETDKFNGKVTNVSKMTVAANGKTMTIVNHDPQRDATSTFTATKK